MTAERLPKPPAEVPRCSSLDGLAPKFRAALALLLDDLRKQGYTPLVYETTRTNARQRFLYGFGRDYDDGRGEVTRSKNTDHTWHGFGLAVDIIDAKLGWDAPADFWRALDVACAKFGLEWGGDWPTMRDLPHVQWGKPMLRSPSANAPRIRDAGGNAAVWRAVGAA